MLIQGSGAMQDGIQGGIFTLKEESRLRFGFVVDLQGPHCILR